MSVKLEDFVISRLEYMQCMLAGGMEEDSDKHNAMSKKVLTLVTTQLHNIKAIDCHAAQGLIAGISSSPMNGADKQQLMCSLTEKVNLAADAEPVVEGVAVKPSGGKNAQVHMYIHNYGTEQLWRGICDRQLVMDVKLQAMAVFLKRIGIRNISAIGPALSASSEVE